jgi:hypothetical protein
MLNPSSSAFIVTSMLSRTYAGDALVSDCRVAASASCVEDSSSVAGIAQTIRITSVTTGPAIATANSAPGERGSRPSCASPPKNHRSMRLTSMPCRMATNAWPSSCRRIDRYSSSAAPTATR